MPRDVEKFRDEISSAIGKFQRQGRTIISRRLIEEEILTNREEYPRLGELQEVPLRMAISAVVNRMPDARVYGKRPTSWTFSAGGSPQGAMA